MEKPAKIPTAITEMFNIDYPILSAPMFLVSNQEMVEASAMAGGLGCFPALNYRPIEKFEEVVKSLKGNLEAKPFGINIIVQKSNRFQEQQIDIALENEVPLIITSLGSPKNIIKRAQGTKTKIFCDVVGLTHAKKSGRSRSSWLDRSWKWGRWPCWGHLSFCTDPVFKKAH